MWQPEQYVPLFLCFSARKRPSAAEVGQEGEKTEAPENHKKAIEYIKVLNFI